RTRCHIEDTSRADYSFVYPFIKNIIEIDPHTIIRICDTLGYGVPFPEEAEPYGIPAIVKGLKKIGVRHVEMHVHDDFGMGVANTLAGLWYGADWANLTFLGIGERAGNAELEKIMAFLITRVDGFEKYNLTRVTDFANFMEEEIGLRVPRNKAIVGKNIFSHESGIHTAGIIKNPFTYEPFPPEIVGGKRSLMIGATSGTEVVRVKAEEALAELLGIKVQVEKTEPRIKCIHKAIQKMYDAEERRSSVSDEEMKSYVQKYFLYQVDGSDEEGDERKPKTGIKPAIFNPELLPLDVVPSTITSIVEKPKVKAVKNDGKKK